MANAADEFSTELGTLAELTPEQLADLETRIVSAFEAADEAGDADALEPLAEALDQVRAEINTRAEDEQPVAAAAEEPAEPEAQADAVAEATDEPTDETTTAVESTDTNTQQEGPDVAVTTAPVESGTLTTPRGNEPVPVAASGSIVRAGADLPGISSGAEFKDGVEFATKFADRVNRLRHLTGGDGEQVVIASIEAPPVDDSRTLQGGDITANWAKIQEVTNVETITAAGGCCAPLTTRYDLFDCGGVTDRPVRDALAGFRADRGGIRFFRGPNLSDVQGGLGFWTCADDAEADIEDPATWKVCSRIDCPPEETAEIQAITRCMTFGVMQARVFPELVTANNRLLMVAQARLADSALLAQIKAGSIRVADAGTPLGAIRDLLNTVARTAMYYRDRYRLDRMAPMRALFPLWVLEVLRGDHIMGMPFGDSPRRHYGISDAEIEGWFTDRGITVTWTLDSAAPATNGGGFFDRMTWTPATGPNDAGLVQGVLPAFPTSVQWALYPEGTWLHLDGGTLDLGVVRDSALIRTNDYMEFGETFEAAANIGCESFWITSAVNVNGAYSAPIVIA